VSQPDFEDACKRADENEKGKEARTLTKELGGVLKVVGGSVSKGATVVFDVFAPSLLLHPTTWRLCLPV